MAAWDIIVVRFLHVLGAIMWLGAGLLFTIVIEPRIRTKPIQERVAEMVGIQARAAAYFPVVAFLTIVSGFILARQLYASFNPLRWSDAAPGGEALQAAFVIAILAFIAGGVNGPVGKRLKALAAAPWTADAGFEATKLLERLRVVGIVDVALLGLATFLMVLASAGGL